MGESFDEVEVSPFIAGRSEPAFAGDSTAVDSPETLLDSFCRVETGGTATAGRGEDGPKPVSGSMRFASMLWVTQEGTMQGMPAELTVLCRSSDMMGRTMP